MKMLNIRKPLINNDINGSILLAIIDNKYYSNGFLYNYYFQICYDKEKGLKFLDYNYFFNEKLFIKKYVEYPLIKNISRDGNGLINYIKFEIDRNRYVISNIYINANIYQGRILIYGYNESEFNIATVYENGGWVTKNISFQKYIDIIEKENIDKNYCTFDILYNNTEFLSEFSIDLMNNELNEYIGNDKNNNLLYGICGINSFFNDNISNFNINLFKISIDTLCLHKFIMLKRLEFLFEKTNLSCNANLIDSVYHSINIIKKMLKLIIDLDNLNKKSNIMSIRELWDEFIKLENRFINELLLCISI